MPKTEMPLIGILTIPDNDTFSNSSTIDASYVKYLDGAGAVTTPILFNATEDEIREQFGYLNGVFFTGGRYRYPLDRPVSTEPPSSRERWIAATTAPLASSSRRVLFAACPVEPLPSRPATLTSRTLAMARPQPSNGDGPLLRDGHAAVRPRDGVGGG